MALTNCSCSCGVATGDQSQLADLPGRPTRREDRTRAPSLSSRKAISWLCLGLLSISGLGGAQANSLLARPNEHGRSLPASEHLERYSHHGQVRQPARREYDTHHYYVVELDAAHQLAWHPDGPAQIASSLGAELVEQLGELQDHYLVRSAKPLSRRDNDEHDAVLARYAALKERSDLIKRSDDHGAAILSLDKQVLRHRVKRFMELGDLSNEVLPRSPQYPGAKQDNKPVPKYLRMLADRFSIPDPLWPKQWHLANDDMRENSINVPPVWEQGINGSNIVVAIVDDGLDMHSMDLEDAFAAKGSWDYNDHTNLPEPRLSDDQHGTRCAGEIAASKNDVCGLGVAYGAKVAGIRILSGPISDADEAAALNHGYQVNDIYSCSWGPPDDGRSMEAPSRLIYKAMLNGIQKGRDGKGSVFVFASGNGGALDDQCNFDGYTNSIFSITVGAIDRKGHHPFYSEACAANMVVTYSSGSGDNIHTTDVGRNKCTDHHGGTSAAAPIAAGIFALVLQVRPDLTWRDMQYLCVQTAVPVNTDEDDWQTTQAGRPYNHRYGYGKLDAYAIVEAAKKHKLVKPQAYWSSPDRESALSLSKAGVSTEIDVTREILKNANFGQLEHVTVIVNITHSKRGDVEVILESPHGTQSILARTRRYDSASTGFPRWKFMSVKHWGESPLGKWKLTVKDQGDSQQNGTFYAWQLDLWGESEDASLARPFKMADDAQVILPKPGSLADLNMTDPDAQDKSNDDLLELQPGQTDATKTIPKPTEHLPSNHSQANLDKPAQTEKPISDIEEPHADDKPPSTEYLDDDSEDDGYLGSMSSMLANQRGFFATVAGVVLTAGCVGAFLVIRRNRLRRREAINRRGYFFESVPAADDEMGLKRGAGDASLGGRTRDLYDAFQVGDSDSDDEEGFRQSESSRLVGRSLDRQRQSLGEPPARQSAQLASADSKAV
ncbi:uncharacterized protein L969DRAFT_90838 [Mixia osmundae IAM 14324]|uniref:P/Homo B domain-containing protein n=1 Tax=Mixia osmundae (strain CBS 9802 / IAM 14324 / JCM 22182 / KY 12970) TaxID=764103 RepID=G7DWA5_MIXOS|nr:uncharacterized protein L969DRAFT_90838 [Mixia osmundae IAM 14324]KEI36507.1 hypothetical protein L969DRAFT_90838 [Mixia osmundae IAM 14324]GAA94793.1 hypothetical protein E5Q_01447 [Mixia osmundae IAM 14324]